MTGRTVTTALPSPEASSRESLRSAFTSIDWAFPNSSATPPHDVHPYPARFIPELPSAALDLDLALPGDVLDPFCGAGTTLVEALRRGRNATGIDLNPIAALISTVKTQRWRDEDDDALPRYALQLREAARTDDAAILAAARERIPRLDHWFTDEAQRVLSGVTAYVHSVADPIWRARISLAISAAVVRVSNQDSDTRYAAVEKSMAESAADAVERSLLRVAAQLRAFAPHHSGATATVVTGDAETELRRMPAKSFAAAIFSPPYPNAYEYWLYHKYRMYWLGFDPLAVRAREIGARPHYSGSGRSTIATFASQMAPVMQRISIALVSGGICFVVVGDSLIKGKVHDNGSLFRELAAEAQLSFVADAIRPIRANRKSFNLAVARIKTEHVLLFRKS